MGEPTTWVPSMDDIRNAHLAEANALETILATLASKQQASMAALRREVEKIAAEQAKLAAAVGRKPRGSLTSLSEATQGGDGASCGTRSDRGNEAGSGDAAGQLPRVNSTMECTSQGVVGILETAASDNDEEDDLLDEDNGQFEGMYK